MHAPILRIADEAARRPLSWRGSRLEHSARPTVSASSMAHRHPARDHARPAATCPIAAAKQRLRAETPIPRRRANASIRAFGVAHDVRSPRALSGREWESNLATCGFRLERLISALAVRPIIPTAAPARLRRAPRCCCPVTRIHRGPPDSSCCLVAATPGLSACRAPRRASHRPLRIGEENWRRCSGPSPPPTRTGAWRRARVAVGPLDSAERP